ncbi:hypothetical protein ACQ4XT_00265 [Halobacillus faecis]
MEEYDLIKIFIVAFETIKISFSNIQLTSLMLLGSISYGFLWLLGKVLSGVLIGLSGFGVALIIYRYLNYHKVHREDVKDSILSFLKRCNGDWGDSTFFIPTKENPEGEVLQKNIYPTTKAVTEWIRMDEQLFNHNRWGFNYGEDFILDVLEDMSFEGCVGAIYNEKTYEVVGWMYCNGRHSFEKVKFWKGVAVEEENCDSISIAQGKIKVTIKQDKVKKIGLDKRDPSIFYILEEGRGFKFACTFRWKAKRIMKQVAKYCAKDG